MTLMLAYGMNTNIDQMAYRCPASMSLGRYDVPDHKLVFRGVADAVYSPGNTLQCVLWDISPECEIALDMLEGYPDLYGKKMLPIDFMGFKGEAMIYYMMDDLSLYHPSRSYQRMLEEGYQAHGLNIDQIYQADGFGIYNYNY